MCVYFIERINVFIKRINKQFYYLIAYKVIIYPLYATRGIVYSTDWA